MKAQIKLTIKDLIFDGMNDTSLIGYTLAFIYFEGIMEIENCIFKNIYFPEKSMIVNGYGNFTYANKIQFINIKVDDRFSFFNLFRTQSYINNILVKDSVFTNFYSLDCDTINSENCGLPLYLQNIVLENNQIKFMEKNITSLSVKRIFDISSPFSFIENITIEPNNQIPVDKQLFFFKNINHVGFKNVKIPLFPQFSASIVSNNATLNIDNHSYSLFNSKVLCVGKLNEIVINTLKNEAKKVIAQYSSL